jgi:hypothetical protein
MKYRDSEDMATQHVEWFLKIIKPIIIEHMIHGYKHGYEKAIEDSLKLLKCEKNG